MERLQKYLSECGVASRRKSEELILQGKVKVNGKIVKELGVKVSETDDIEVNGIYVKKEEKEYYILNKPEKPVALWLRFLIVIMKRIKFTIRML